MTADHTSGPWSITFHNSKGFDDLGDWGDWTIYGADGTAIAIESCRPNKASDLRLIAASPSLLVACQNLLTSVKTGHNINEAIGWAEEAIAKALGETNGSDD